MRETAIGIHTIGQTPRPDLLELFGTRFDSMRFEIRGALDDLRSDEIPRCSPNGYPLETRLRDGSQVVVDAEFLAPRLQVGIDECDERVEAHLILCAGRFPELAARNVLIQPFEAAAAVLRERGLAELDIVVPFAGQAGPAVRKWKKAGFACRAHAWGGEPGEDRAGSSMAMALAERITQETCDALVFDYVGFPVTILRSVAKRVDIPVFDVGRLGLDALEQALAEKNRTDE